jgi:hypothetical protein
MSTDVCVNLGCENPRVEIGEQCAECIDATPNPDSADSTQESTAEGDSPDANPGVEAVESPAAIRIPDDLEVVHENGRVIARQPINPDTGVRTDPDEFLLFDELLRENAPDGYTPHYLPVTPGAKGPDTRFGAWSTTDARLSTSAAVRRLESGGNVGIAGIGADKDAPQDPLADLDIDDPTLVDDDERKPSLGANSRSRIGGHGFYFADDELPNIDCAAGELRTDTQFVVAPGSQVSVVLSDPDEPNLADIPESEHENIGRYTIADDGERPAATLEYDELPAIYREKHEEKQRIENERPDRREEPPEPKSSTGDRTACFDLDVTDVTGMSWGERGVNGLGNHSHDDERDSYFVLLKDRGVAYDHKANVAFSAASYALAAAGARDPDAPNGGLTDEEYFIYWKWCKENGLVEADDPIPTRALQHLALSRSLCDREDIEDGWKLPSAAYNAALDVARDEYDLDPGRDPLGDSSGEPVAMLPQSPKADAITSGWDWTGDTRNAGISLQNARERTQNAIETAIEDRQDTLIDALPSAAKSSGSIRAAAARREPILFLTTRGNEEQYGQIAEWCDEQGLTHETLPSVKRECETMNGEFGPEAKERAESAYQRGVTGKELHMHLDMPCDNTDGMRCSYKAAWDRLETNPENDGAPDVLIGHYLHGYLYNVSESRTVIIDEFPGDAYEFSMYGRALSRAVTRYLESTELPFEDFTDLLTERESTDKRRDSHIWFDENSPTRSPTQALNTNDGHALAPLITAMLIDCGGERHDLGNGWEYARQYDDARISARGGFDRENQEIHILQPPAFTGANATIALDGTPTKQMWNLAVGPHLHHRQILDDDTRKSYIRDALALQVLQTTNAVKPYSSNPLSEHVGHDDTGHVAVEQDAALLAGIEDQHGERPALITTQNAKKAYQSDDATAHILQFARENTWDAVGHYGNLHGSNERGDTRLGAVIGSRNFGDGFVQKWGAFAGESVPEPDRSGKETRGVNLSYGGGIGDEIHRHMTVSETLQAVMRFGRDGNGAVVYLHTNTLPDWFPVAGEPPTEADSCIHRTRSDGERGVIRALRDLETAATKEIVAHDAVDIGRRAVGKHLKRLADDGHIVKIGETKGTEWTDDGLDALPEIGEVDLPELSGTPTYGDSIRARSRKCVNLPHDSPTDTNALEKEPLWMLADGGEPPPNDRG